MNQLKIKLRLFPQKVTDKITYEVNKIIKQAKKGSNDYNVQRKKILDDLKLFYGDPNNYTDVELQEHKEFLYSQKKGLLERIDSEFWELYKSTILSLLTITFSMLFILNNLVVSTNVSEDVKEINILAQSGYAAILTLVGWIVIVTSIKSVMVFRGRKYRKYKNIKSLNMNSPLLICFKNNTTRRLDRVWRTIWHFIVQTTMEHLEFYK